MSSPGFLLNPTRKHFVFPVIEQHPLVSQNEKMVRWTFAMVPSKPITTEDRGWTPAGKGRVLSEVLGDQGPQAASAVPCFHLILTMTPRGHALIVPRIVDGDTGAQGHSGTSLGSQG